MTMSTPGSGAASPEAPAPNSIPQLRFTQSLDEVRPELPSLLKDDLLQPNLDPQAAVTTVLGCVPKILVYRGQVLEELPRFEIRHLDRLETYALALGSADAHYHAASTPSEPVQELAEQLIKIRDLLLSDITALANRNMLNGDRLKGLNGTQGYRNVAFDVLALCAMLRENWTTVAGKTGVQVAELDSAEQHADRLVTAVGRREQGQTAVTEAADTRQRVFTLFIRSYEEVRRAITYLRWHEDDVDRIAPSLYANRGSRRKTDIEPEPAAPSPAVSPATPAAPAPAAPPVAPGLPGGNPLID
ncbi:MAG: hypothetical protein HOW73_39110 [Polyangiaceae bacterium]|nr:hypothetical protein [Polyangiaceae bacterium]